MQQVASVGLCVFEINFQHSREMLQSWRDPTHKNTSTPGEKLDFMFKIQLTYAVDLVDCGNPKCQQSDNTRLNQNSCNIYISSEDFATCISDMSS